MNTPIIDPSTLTEDQKRTIIAKYDYSYVKLEQYNDKELLNRHIAKVEILIWLFGEKLFKDNQE